MTEHLSGNRDSAFTRGQRVRIVDEPTSITRLQAGREGQYLGPTFLRGRPLEDTVTVVLDSGIAAFDSQVILSPRDLEPVA